MSNIPVLKTIGTSNFFGSLAINWTIMGEDALITVFKE